MAGGPSTPELVIAAARAGALGFLAAGYQSPASMRAAIDAVRAPTGGVFGVNVFVPGTPAAGPEVAAYVASLAPDAARLGVSPGEPAWDDDHWPGKIDALLADPPPVVSFTFGCPPASTIAAFAECGSLVVVTVTSAGEAALAAGAGAGCLCVQGPEAGAHRGTFSNAPPGETAAASDRATAGGQARTGDQAAAARPGPRLLDLLAEVTAVTDLPLAAAGGLAGPDGVSAVLTAGAAVAQLGTAFLRCPESGAHPAHKAALTDPRYTATAVTRAFSGRPARGLVNQFMLDHPAAPAAYPEISNATRPIRAAAAAAGDAGRMSLWAGAGFRSASGRPPPRSSPRSPAAPAEQPGPPAGRRS
jgi:nitronate monooxygenase